VSAQYEADLLLYQGRDRSVEALTAWVEGLREQYGAARVRYVAFGVVNLLPASAIRGH
jgi:hypothetical protein